MDSMSDPQQTVAVSGSYSFLKNFKDCDRLVFRDQQNRQSFFLGYPVTAPTSTNPQEVRDSSIFIVQGFDFEGNCNVKSFPDTSVELVQQHAKDNLKSHHYCVNYLPGYGTHYLKDLRKNPVFRYDPQFFMFFYAKPVSNAPLV